MNMQVQTCNSRYNILKALVGLYTHLPWSSWWYRILLLTGCVCSRSTHVHKADMIEVIMAHILDDRLTPRFTNKRCYTSLIYKSLRHKIYAMHVSRTQYAHIHLYAYTMYSCTNGITCSSQHHPNLCRSWWSSYILIHCLLLADGCPHMQINPIPAGSSCNGHSQNPRNFQYAQCPCKHTPFAIGVKCRMTCELARERNVPLK